MYCLSDTDANKVPTKGFQKVLLNEAGLGIKDISFPIDATYSQFREIILNAYPQLQDCGGFEFLRCPANTKSLEMIPTSCYLPKHLKAFIGNGKVFIRPLQKSIDIGVKNDDEVCAYFTV